MNEQLKQLGATLALRMKSHVQAALAPLAEKLAALEARAPVPGEKGLDGKDGLNGKDGRDGLDGKAGDVGAAGKDGQDAAPMTAAFVLEALQAAPALLEKAIGLWLTQHPPAAGLDGKDGTNGIDGKDGAVGAPGADGAAGRDGKDGRDGLAGKDGRDGLNGKDGLDGLGFDDLTFALGEDLRTLSLKFTRGDKVKAFDVAIPLPLYRGVFESGTTYAPGDVVTKGGSMWFAKESTSAIPGEGVTGWTLCVKQGREGKTGAPGKQGEPGLAGKDGRDLTQLGTDGRKW